MIVPNFAPGPSAKHYKAVLDTPVASQAFRWLMPYKFADPEDYADRTRYRYPFHEVNSVRQMFLLQEKVTPEQIRVRRGVFLMTGSKDTTVSTEALVQKLEKKRTEEGIEYRAFEYDAGHSLLQDAAKQVQKQILEILAEHPTEE
jgi:predicted esterase